MYIPDPGSCFFISETATLLMCNRIRTYVFHVTKPFITVFKYRKSFLMSVILYVHHYNHYLYIIVFEGCLIRVFRVYHVQVVPTSDCA